MHTCGWIETAIQQQFSELNANESIGLNTGELQSLREGEAPAEP
jgi:hypothetical protein